MTRHNFHVITAVTEGKDKWVLRLKHWMSKWNLCASVYLPVKFVILMSDDELTSRHERLLQLISQLACLCNTTYRHLLITLVFNSWRLSKTTNPTNCIYSISLLCILPKVDFCYVIMPHHLQSACAKVCAYIIDHKLLHLLTDNAYVIVTT